ncbi:MAG: hypothetical protein RLO15_10785 [Parvibaculum sp.]
MEGLCSCEHISRSEFGLIDANERIVRVILSPIHINKRTGEVKPSAFPVSHLMEKGFSLMRLEKMDSPELQRQAEAIRDAATRGTGLLQEVKGVVVSTASELREIYDEEDRQAFCLFDEPVEAGEDILENKAHSVAIRSLDQDSTEVQGLRDRLIDIFGKLLALDKAYS